MRFDGNDYSVPDDRVRRAVTVFGSSAIVRITDGTEGEGAGAIHT